MKDEKIKLELSYLYDVHINLAFILIQAITKSSRPDSEWSFPGEESARAVDQTIWN